MKKILMFVLLGSLGGWAASEMLTSQSSPDRTIFVSADLTRSAYLGLSVYPKKGTALHQVHPVRAGHLQETFPLDTSYVGGTYEVALWDRQVPRSKCKTKDCAWCKANGFHMEGMRSYSSGVVGR